MIILYLKKYSRFFKKLRIKLPYDPTIPLLGKYPEKTMTERDICTPMFVAALFTIAWLQKLWYINIIEYYSAIKKNIFESVLMRWMNLDPLYSGKKSESKRPVLYINACVWNLERWYWWACLQGSSWNTETENRLVDTVGEGDGGKNWKDSMEIYTLSYGK